MEFKLKYKQAGCDMVEVFRIFGKFSRIETWSSLGCKELAVQLDSYSVETEKARQVYTELVKKYCAVRA
jgi:hypothetical protein